MVNWVSQYCNDPEFQIIPISSGGDCFFAAVEKAFAYEGSKVTEARLRDIVSRGIDESAFMEYYTTWQEAQAAQNAPVMARLLFMQGVEDVATLKRVAQTPRFSVNIPAIQILESALRIKFVLFSQKRYATQEFPCVFGTELNHNPQWYVLLDYDGSHYNLISYKGMTRLTSDQIPLNVQVDLACKPPAEEELEKTPDLDSEDLEHVEPESEPDTEETTSQDSESSQ